MREELRPRAQERVTRALVLGKVVEEEELSVTDEDISARIGMLAGSVQDPEGNILKALNTPRSRRRIENDLLFERAIDRLVAIAKGEDPPMGNPEPKKREEDEAAVDGIIKPGVDPLSTAGSMEHELEDSVAELEAELAKLSEGHTHEDSEEESSGSGESGTETSDDDGESNSPEE